MSKIQLHSHSHAHNTRPENWIATYTRNSSCPFGWIRCMTRVQRLNSFPFWVWLINQRRPVVHDDACVPSLALSIVTCSGQQPPLAGSRVPFRPCAPPPDDRSGHVGRCRLLSTSRLRVDVSSFPLYHLTQLDTQLSGRAQRVPADVAPQRG